MNTLFGITGIRVYMTYDIDELNKFLTDHDGNIVDIQCTDKYFHVIYKEA
jgi:hypothetical protein